MEGMQQRGQNDVKRMSAMQWGEREAQLLGPWCKEAGYTRPAGNKRKLKGGDLRSHEKDNVLDFGTGERGGDEWAPR